jgi:hypothetical protein
LFHWLANSHTAHSVGIWIAAIGTLAIYSVLYKENPVYRLFEHIFIGAAAGYSIYVTWTQILQPLWWDKIAAGQWTWMFALVAGAMFYFIYSQRHMWISRIVFGTLLGLISGAAFKGFAGINIDRIHAAFKPVAGHGMKVSESMNNLVFIVVLLAVMSYFFFSFEHKNRITSAPAKLGRWLLMFSFGAMFGSTVMARMSLLIGRIYFLLGEWLHVAH